MDFKHSFNKYYESGTRSREGSKIKNENQESYIDQWNFKPGNFFWDFKKIFMTSDELKNLLESNVNRKQINLDNGTIATIGYYDGSNIWQDISFFETNKYVAVKEFKETDDEIEILLEYAKNNLARYKIPRKIFKTKIHIFF